MMSCTLYVFLSYATSALTLHWRSQPDSGYTYMQLCEQPELYGQTRRILHFKRNLHWNRRFMVLH